MLRRIVDRSAPAAALVLTGENGFRSDIDRLLNNGWGVEVLSFSVGFGARLKPSVLGTGAEGNT